MKPLFDRFRSSFTNPWPVHVTKDTNDYAAVQNYNSAYVWIKHPDANVREDFDYAWRPDPKDSNRVFAFPICDKSLRPYSWSSMKLVPTVQHTLITEPVHMNIPASIFQTERAVLLLGTSRNNMALHTTKYPNAMYLGAPSTTDRVASRINLLTHGEHSLVFYEHVNSTTIDLRKLKLEPGVLYLTKAKNLLTRKVHTSANVMLAPDGPISRTEVLNIEVETNDLTGTPDVMWKRGWLDAQVLLALGEKTDAIAKVKAKNGPARFYMKGFLSALEHPDALDVKSPWYGATEIDALYDKYK